MADATPECTFVTVRSQTVEALTMIPVAIPGLPVIAAVILPGMTGTLLHLAKANGPHVAVVRWHAAFVVPPWGEDHVPLKKILFEDGLDIECPARSIKVCP